MASDKPKNVISVSDLGDIEENPDPIKVPLKGGKFVTFPDVYDMPIEEAESFFLEVNRGMNSGILTAALRKWLSEEDFAALIEAFPTYRKLNPVIQRVMTKYEAQWGTEGEGGASTA